MAFGLCSTSKRVSHVSRGVTGVAYPWQGEYGWLDTPWGNMRTRHLTNEQAPQHKYAHIYMKRTKTRMPKWPPLLRQKHAETYTLPHCNESSFAAVHLWWAIWHVFSWETSPSNWSWKRSLLAQRLKVRRFYEKLSCPYSCASSTSSKNTSSKYYQ